MKLKSKRIDSHTLLYFCFGLWYGTEIIFKSNLSLTGIENITTYVVSFILLIQICFFQIYEPIEILKIITISLIILVSTVHSRELYILSCWLFIVAFKDADFDQVMRIAFILLTIGILIIVGLFTIGVIPDVIIYRGSITRHSLGFDHPNQFGLALLQWVICYCYLYWERLGLLDLVLMGILAYIVYSVADSQTAIVCIVLMIVFVIVMKLLDYFKLNYGNLLSTICSIGSLTIMIGSLILTYIDIRKYTILNLMDIILSYRFYYCHKMYLQYGFSLFGNAVSLTGSDVASGGLSTLLFLDNAYASICIRYGIVFAFIFICSYYMLYRTLRNTPKITIILFVLSVFGIMGTGFYRLYRNNFLLLISYLLYESKRNHEITAIDHTMDLKNT